MNRIQKFFTQIKGLLVHRFFQVLLFIILGLFAYGLMFSNVKPERVQVELLSLRNKRSDQPRLWKIPIRRNRKKKRFQNRWRMFIL